MWGGSGEEYVLEVCVRNNVSKRVFSDKANAREEEILYSL